ncbi:IS3 family transposase [Streptomyces sp. NPDC048411]|uniref:IS3 family transposase n=1 Tax=Streptomyces sp. NPDC048411 TaxID=3157206 RepID=UPI0034550E48
MSKKSNASKRYTTEFKKDAVELVRSSGRTVAGVARELGVSTEGLRGWVKQAKSDRGRWAGGLPDGGGARGTGPAAAQGPRAGADDRGARKSDGLLRAAQDEAAVRYAFVDAEKTSRGNPGGYSVPLLCRALKVTRSARYAYFAARPAAETRQAAEEELVGEIRQVHTDSRGAYGAPRVTAALRRTGRRINRKKVERIMRERDIRGNTRRKRRSLTKAGTKVAPSPDLLGRDFTAAEPGTKLVSDITCLPTLAAGGISRRSSIWRHVK